MNKTLRVIISLTFLTASSIQSAQAWDPQPTNPFPGVAFGAEVPGYTVQVPCLPNDCGIGIVPVVNCPPWTAADGGGGFDAGYAKRFCRNSWTPPTTSADDDDFRNRQQLAVAAATLESQNYNAAHPGEQKCVTWGPVVHANGISTASGGVCANPVGTTAAGTTVQVAPSQVSSDSSGTASTPAASPPVVTNESATVTTPPVVTKPSIDFSQYGVGKPFTRVVAGNLTTSQCPSGYQSASNQIPGIANGGATECWPENAWTAYSVGGDIWSKFKASNGSFDAQAETNRRVQVNALRSLALQQAQLAANETVGIKRCNSWSGFGESGQECAYIPFQNSSPSGGLVNTSKSDTSTSLIKENTQVGNLKVESVAGLTLSQWQASDSYTAISCPSGSGKSSSINLNGTISISDDFWVTICVEVANSETIQIASDTNTINGSPIDSTTVVSNFSESVTAVSASAITEDPISYSGTMSEILGIAKTLEMTSQELNAIATVSAQLSAIKTNNKIVKVSLPNSLALKEVAKTLTPAVCKVSGLTVQPLRSGNCLVSYFFEGTSGNEFTTTKKLVFKK
jgi:hypothetical protein